MAAIDDIRTEIAAMRTNNGEIATELEGIGARIDALIAQLDGGVSAEDATALVAELQSVRDAQQVAEDRARELATTPPTP